MCYTKQASIGALLTGFLSSVALLVLGDEKYKQQNIAIGIFFIYVSLVQLVDYMIYVDPKCKTGENKLAGYFGPLLTGFQPTIIFLIFTSLLNQQKKNTLYNKYPTFFNAINVLYALILYVFYSQFILQEDVCSRNENGRPKWSWQKGPIYSFLYFGYPIILLINIIAIVSESLFYVNLAIILTFIMYLISKINYANHVGEFWCYFSNSVPLLVLITQKILG
jgi:hypothetical protein